MGGPTKKNFFKEFLLININLFCDKTSVVRPTSDLKKLKFLKMGKKSVENRQYIALGAFLGVGPKKKIFFKKFQLIYINLFLGQNFCCQTYQ